MKYLVIDTTVLSEGTVNPENDLYIIGIFDTIANALAARGHYHACYPDLDFHNLEICPLRPNKFYDDRVPIMCDWKTDNFKDSEEELLYAISDIRD